MNKKFVVLVCVLIVIIIFLNNFASDKTQVDFNPLELEIGDSFKYIDTDESRIVLNYEIGDVTGDNENDMIIVIGKKSGEELTSQNISVVLYDIKNNKFTDAKLKKYSGSLPDIRLKDVDGDKVNDVIIVTDLENMGKNMRIVTFSEAMPKEIFKEKDNNGLEVNGVFLDGFKAVMQIKKLKKDVYTDLKDNKQNYITSGFYMENGKLNTDKINLTSAGIEDIDFVNFDNRTGIKFVERVKGFDNLDIIEQIEVMMRYENGNWVFVEVKGDRMGVL